MKLPASKIRPLESRMRIALPGLTGSGKGNRAKSLIAREWDGGKGWPTIVIDPHDEYSVQGKERPGEVVLGCLPTRLSWSAWNTCWRDLIDDPRLGLAIVANGEPEETAEELADLVNLLESTGGVFLVMDELHRYQEHAARTLNRLAFESRKWRVPVCFVTQRMTDIPKGARTQLTDVDSGLQLDDEDVDALRRRCGKDFAERVPLLRPGESVYWSDSHQLTPARSERKSSK
jgi:Helicase HerA, central domain